MSKIHWKSRRAIGFVVIIFVIFLSIRIKQYENKAAVFINKIHPSEVWEFVADFSNMKYLNPTIVDFNIINESGNYDHWKYTIEYTEHLSHWPNLPNHNLAHFDIKASPNKDAYFIYSTHKTCMLNRLICLDTTSEFKFIPSKNSGTICEEIINYQCPAFLSSVCKREVVYQRTAIMGNLKKHFEKK